MRPEQVSPKRPAVSRRALLRGGLLAAAGAAVGCARPPAPGPAAPDPRASAPAATVPAVSAAPSGAPAVARELDVVRQGGVGVNHTVEIARIRGYFRDVGIDLQDEHFTSGAQQTPLLASGQLDVGSTSVQSAHFNAVSRGVALRLVVDKGHLEPGANTQAVVLRADLVPGGEPPPIAEIRGRTMAISTDPKQGGTGFGVARMLATVGLTLDDVDWKLMPNRDMADFIANRGARGAVVL